MHRALLTTLLAAALAAAFLGARTRPVRFPEAPAGPTFSNEVVRIFQARCQSCHHPGDIAPFSLMTYADAKPYAGEIKLMTGTHQMPPWKPVSGCAQFSQARVLPQSEIDLLAQWVDAGAPEGDRSQLPPPLLFEGAWSLGQPDLVLSYPEAYTPPSTGDMYRCFTIPTNLTSDQYVSAIDVHPGDRQTVHHVIAYIDTTGESVKLDEQDPGPGYTSFGGPGFSIANANAATLGGWAPGARPIALPDGVAMSLPAQSRVVLQVHYHPHGPAPLPDKTEIGIYFAKKPPTKLLRILPLINTSFTIPPGDPNYRVTAQFTVPFFADAHLWQIAPHMHLLGRRMTVQATLPNGQSQCLITINDWDFNWQGLYMFDQPVPIPGGTTLSLQAFFDNSEDNVRNPNFPPKPVSWGEQTTDEMCIAFLGVTIDQENLALGHTVDASWIPPITQ
jgi:mono/diheme cytochrome c family protein